MFKLFNKVKILVLNMTPQHLQDDFYDPESQSPQYLQKYLVYKHEHKKRLILIVTVGRSGSRWLATIFNSHNRVKGSCEKNNHAESFYKYVKWNQLPIDISGVFNTLAATVLKDWKNADVSVIASPAISIDFLDVCNNLEVDEVIWCVNDAKFTVNSLYNKGWYINGFCTQDPNLAIGFQPFYSSKFTRLFSRLLPRGKFYYTWEKLTRVGKISWFYNIYNLIIYEQIQTIDPRNTWIMKLEDADQNYDYYLKMVKRFNLTPTLTEGRFLAIKEKLVNPEENEKKEWSPQEVDEFEVYTNEFQEIYLTLKN